MQCSAALHELAQYRPCPGRKAATILSFAYKCLAFFIFYSGSKLNIYATFRYRTNGGHKKRQGVFDADEKGGLWGPIS